MKAHKTNTVISKLVNRFDDQLLNILLEDFRNFRERNQFMNNKKVTVQQTLPLA
nr:hypothetical protein [Mucilaginibacter sp. FT3.2]